MIIYAVIPARSGSKSIKDKNIIKLNGKPLIQYSIELANQIKSVKKIIFTSDSDRYLNIAKKFSNKLVLHKREKNISGDRSTDFQFFKSCIEYIKKNQIIMPDLFIHLRPTTPIRNIKVVNKAIGLFKNSKFTSLRSVHLNPASSYKHFEIKNNKLVTIFKRDSFLDISNFSKNDYPKTYIPNGYVDIIRTKNIYKGHIHGNKVMPYITDTVYEIDSLDELDLIKKLMANEK